MSSIRDLYPSSAQYEIASNTGAVTWEAIPPHPKSKICVSFSINGGGGIGGDGDGGCGGVLAVDGHCEIKICSSQYRAFKLLAGSPNLVQHYQKNKENSHFRQNFPRFLRVFV